MTAACSGPVRYPAMRADGTERIVELTPVPVTVDGVVHFCAFMRDITELEHAHAELTDSEARFASSPGWPRSASCRWTPAACAPSPTTAGAS